MPVVVLLGCVFMRKRSIPHNAAPSKGAGVVGRRNMARRLWKGLRYLDPMVLAYGVLALNSGYLSKMAIDGTLKLGADKTKSGT